MMMIRRLTRQGKGCGGEYGEYIPGVNINPSAFNQQGNQGGLTRDWGHCFHCIELFGCHLHGE
jgi:hypothetical protein